MQCKGTPGGGALILFSGDDRLNHIDGLTSEHFKGNFLNFEDFKVKINVFYCLK